MKLSILLPTRNGGALLEPVIRSVLEQDCDDFELVVSNNASADATPEIIASFASDPRLRVVTLEQPVDVTDNWNRALHAATGDYVTLIGDDDLLLSGYFERVFGLLEEYEDPDSLTFNAYAYAFPGFAGAEHSHYADPFYVPQPIVPSDGLVSARTRRHLVSEMFSFRFPVHLNMQTALVSRRMFERLPRGLFRPPFPDFYGLNAIMLVADRWAISAAKPVVVGVSPKSFGRTLHGREQGAGLRYLGISTAFEGQLPGSEVMNGTHLTLVELERDFPAALAGLTIDRDEYVMAQAYTWYVHRRLGSLASREVLARLRLLSARDWAGLVRMSASRLRPAKLRRALRMDRDAPVADLWPGMRPLPEVSDIVEFARWIDARRAEPDA
ncbi:MAG TPA: glycosyltransferase family 2 protein [Solirubrobacteraceae bacterium]